jgi:CrcB protein
MTTFLLVSVAGGLGAVLRFILDSAVRARFSGYPLGTLLINLSGSLLLGLLAGVALAEPGLERWHVVLGTGFLGGYTTFSTASFEAVTLLREGRALAAVLHAGGMLLASVALAALGLWLGLQL